MWSGNHIHESGELIHESGELIHESEELIHESGRLIHESGELIHESEGLIHESGGLIHESGGLIQESGELIHESEEDIHVEGDPANPPRKTERLVAPGRLERPTNSLGNCCSIHLSYGATRGGKRPEGSRKVQEGFEASRAVRG